MRDVLDAFVRSLAERESGRTGPEDYQDLGGYVCWLLERHGHQILRRSFRYEGRRRQLLSGVREDGVDIVSSRPDPDGVERVYRFVLKHGHIGRSDWSPGVPGSMLSDLWLAAGLGPESDARHIPAVTAALDRMTLVAVHNGDLKTDQIGGQLNDQLDKIRRGFRENDTLEWWQALNLVELAQEAMPGADNLDRRADTGIFPPSTRPFVRLALDSLIRAEHGAEFDLKAVDLLLDKALPLGVNCTQLHLHRRAAELALFVEMLAVECRYRAGDNVLPVLDACERVLCRILAHSGARGRRDNDIRAAVDAILARYTRSAQTLADHLRPVMDAEHGLAWPKMSEPVDYPLRTLRLTAYLAVAGLVHLDLGESEPAVALAEQVKRLWANNPGGALTPVIDDQVIELCLVWELWIRLGMTAHAGESAWQLFERLRDRYLLGLPLPCVAASAGLPWDGNVLEPLVRAWLDGRNAAWPRFDDRPTTILPVAIYIAMTYSDVAPTAADDLLRAFDPTPSRVVFPQTWQPPDDAPEVWYTETIRDRGDVRVERLELGASAMVDGFCDFVRRCQESTAQRWRRPSIDRMAWKTWRNPPPMAILRPQTSE